MTSMNEMQMALVKELVKLREVGIAELDVLEPSGDFKVNASWLDSAAFNLRDGAIGLTRSEAISSLLRSEIAKLSNAEYREWLPVSLGVKLGLATADPEELNKMAAKLANHPSPNDFKRSNGRLQRAFHTLAAKIVAGYLQKDLDSNARYPATERDSGLPSAPVVDLLSAQILQASEQYSLFGRGTAHISYVEQRLLRDETDIWSPIPIHLRDILDECRHIGVTGSGGSGKTTLALQSVAMLSKQILDGDCSASRWAPIYVTAESLVGRRSLTDLLADAVQSNLAGLLSARLEPSIFAAAPKNMQGWIIFIDGFDEVAQSANGRQLTDVVKAHLNREHFKFVLLGRTLDEHLVTDVSIKSYQIAPFDGWQFRCFCRSWFAANGFDDSHAIRLIQQADSNGVLDMLDKPLLATISCYLYSESSGRALPATAVELYESFIDYLLFRRRGQNEARRRIESLFAPYGSRGDGAAAWLYDARRDICTYIALEIMNPCGESPDPLAAGLRFVNTRLFGRSADLPWHEALEEVLPSTGLFARRGAELTYIHRSLIEYLAAPVLGLAELRYEGATPGRGRYRYEQGDRQDLLDMILLWWAKQPPQARQARHDWPTRHGGSQQVLRCLLKTASPACRLDIARLVSTSDLTLDSYLLDPLLEFFRGPDLGLLYARDEHATAMLDLERDVNSILGRLAKERRVADFLLERAMDPSCSWMRRLERLAWLLGTVHHGLALIELDMYLDESNSKLLMDVSEAALRSGNFSYALDVARLSMADAGQLFRSAEVIRDCGSYVDALTRYHEAFVACDGWVGSPGAYSFSSGVDEWDLRIAIAVAIARMGELDDALDLLRSALNALSIEERSISILARLREFGFSELIEEQAQVIIATKCFHLNDSRDAADFFHFGTATPGECEHAPGCVTIETRDDLMRLEEFSGRRSAVDNLMAQQSLAYLHDHLRSNYISDYEK